MKRVCEREGAKMLTMTKMENSSRNYMPMQAQALGKVPRMKWEQKVAPKPEKELSEKKLK